MPRELVREEQRRYWFRGMPYLIPVRIWSDGAESVTVIWFTGEHTEFGDLITRSVRMREYAFTEDLKGTTYVQHHLKLNEDAEFTLAHPIIG